MIQAIFNMIWEKITQISPSIFWSSFIFLVGVALAKSIEEISIAFLNRIRLNRILARMGLKEVFARLDIDMDAAKFFGEIMKWFVIILFSMFSFGTLGLSDIAKFLQSIILYFPNIFIAMIIFVAAAFMADFSQKLVVGTLEKEKITYSKFLGRSIRWIIWFFAILIIFYQLKIAPSMILAIFIGMVATISIALGIAFGLGGKDLATKILKELEEKFK